jgi:hypothetical protein
VPTPVPVQYLKAIALASSVLGQQMSFYLAAAVSDFYIPWSDMVRSPISDCYCCYSYCCCFILSISVQPHGCLQCWASAANAANAASACVRPMQRCRVCLVHAEQVTMQRQQFRDCTAEWMHACYQNSW